MLLEFGADIKKLNSDGVSSYDIANMEDYKDIKMLYTRWLIIIYFIYEVKHIIEDN